MLLQGQISEERSLPVALWVRNFVSEALEPTKENWFTVNKNLVDSGAALPIDWYGSLIWMWSLYILIDQRRMLKIQFHPLNV